MKLVQFPAVLDAVKSMKVDGGGPVSDDGLTTIGQQKVPAKWLERVQKAEVALSALKGKKLNEVLDESEIDSDLADPQDDAFETFVTGEGTVQELIAAQIAYGQYAGAVLESFFDGDLSYLLDR